MECVRKYCCRSCYHDGDLEMLSGVALDIYTLICNRQELEDDTTQIFVCFRCHKFLEEVHCFRDERHGAELRNRDVKPHKVDLLLSRGIDENSAKIGIKTEIINEDDEMDQIDIQINKVEVEYDPESSQEISETSRESLSVTNIEKSGNNSLKLKNTNSFKCNECSYETNKSSTLNQHIVHNHSNEKRFSCNQCNYRCKSKSNLKSHSKIHSTNREKPFKCNKCSHATNTAGHLKAHVLYVHSDERPFSCDQCKSNFKTKSDLSQHKIKSHGVGFKRDSGLSKHLQKPLKCNECSYETTKTTLMNQHILYKHNEGRRFSCDQCDLRFKTKWELNKHKKTHLSSHESELL